MAYYSEEEQRMISDAEQAQEFQSARNRPIITNPITNNSPADYDPYGGVGGEDPGGAGLSPFIPTPMTFETGGVAGTSPPPETPLITSIEDTSTAGATAFPSFSPKEKDIIDYYRANENERIKLGRTLARTFPSEFNALSSGEFFKDKYLNEQEFLDALGMGELDQWLSDPNIIENFAQNRNQTFLEVASRYGTGGPDSYESELHWRAQKGGITALSPAEQADLDEYYNLLATGGAPPLENQTGVFGGGKILDASGNVISEGSGDQKPFQNPEELIYGGDLSYDDSERELLDIYERQFSLWLSGPKNTPPPAPPSGLAKFYVDQAGNRNFAPQFSALQERYEAGLAESSALANYDRERQRLIEERQAEWEREWMRLEKETGRAEIEADALKSTAETQAEATKYAADAQERASNWATYQSQYTQRFINQETNKRATQREEFELQLARITQTTEQEVADMYSRAQVAVAERNNISAREVADIQAGVGYAETQAGISIASIEQQMQQEIARLTGLDERYIADAQASAQQAIALENRKAQEAIALEDRTANIQIAESANSTEAQIAQINAEAQIAIADDNRISQETVALANSLNVVAAAEATGLSQEAVARIQGEWQKQISDSTGLSQQQVAQIQSISQENTANIQATAQRIVSEAQAQAQVQAAQAQAEGQIGAAQAQASGQVLSAEEAAQAQIQAAQQAAQAQTGVAQLGAAEQRFATTTEAATQRNIAQLQADTQTQIAQIQANTTIGQSQKDIEIANVQRQAQEAIARIQQEGQLAIAQQQTNPFGLTPAQYMQMQTQQTAPSPAETLTTQQYINLQESLARGGLTPAQQIQLYEAQQQAQGASQRAGLSPEQFIGLQESVARGGLTADQRLAEQQQGQQVQALTSLLSLLSNPSALGALSSLTTGQTPFGGAIPSAAALQGRSNEFLNFLQGAFGALGVTPSALVNLVQGVTPGGISNPFGALTGQVA